VALGSYQALLESKDIDAVYIPLPTGLRKEWIIAAAKHGKHILAEKPAALTAADVQEILDVCKTHGVQFMDGVMFMHSRRLEQLRQTLDSPTGIGSIKRIATQFSFYSDQEFRTTNIRSNSKYEPHGSLGDLGWYTIRMILWINQWRMPFPQTFIALLRLSTSSGVTSAAKREAFGSTISSCRASAPMSGMT